MNKQPKIDTTPKQDYDLSLLIPKADAGDLQAMYDVLSAVVQADDGNESVDPGLKARLCRYAQALMDADEPSGYFYMAQFCAIGDMVEKDVQQAAQLHIRAGDLGALFAYEYAGLLYYYGDGIEQDYEKAFALIKKGDETSLQPEPLFALAEMLRQGLGTEQNAEKANTLYISFLSRYAEIADSYMKSAPQMANDLALLCARVHFRLAEVFETGGGGLDQSLKDAQEQIRTAVQMIVNEKKDDRKFGIETQTIYETFARITGIPMEDRAYLTNLQFCEYIDFDDEKIARMQTQGGDSGVEIPVNILVEPGSDFSMPEDTFCMVELFAADFEVDTYVSAKDVSESTGMADISMIPMGTFPLKPDDPDFRQSPWIIFTGKVIRASLRRCRDTDPDDCDYALCVTVETLDMLVSFELECNADVEVGEYWHGTAFLSAVIRGGDHNGSHS